MVERKKTGKAKARKGVSDMCTEGDLTRALTCSTLGSSDKRYLHWFIRVNQHGRPMAFVDRSQEDALIAFMSSSSSVHLGLPGRLVRKRDVESITVEIAFPLP